MARTYSYDEAVAATKPIKLSWGDQTFEFPGEAPIDVALDWYRIQSDRNLSMHDRVTTNYALVFGETTFDLIRAERVPFPVVDRMYRDLLHEWGLWRRTAVDQESVAVALERLRNAVEAEKPKAKLFEILDLVSDLLAGTEVEDDDETADAENSEVGSGGA